MAQPTDCATRQPPILNFNSPFVKAVSYLPYVGIISSLFAERALKIEDRATNGVKVIEFVEILKEYKHIDWIRNLVSAALIVCAVALGILGAPTGAMIGLLLTNMHLLFAWTNKRRIKEIDEALNSLRSANPQHL